MKKLITTQLQDLLAAPKQLFRGYLAEPYDGIGQYIMVTLSHGSTAGAYRARIAAGDFGTSRIFPEGTPVVLHSNHGQLEVLSLGGRRGPWCGSRCPDNCSAADGRDRSADAFALRPISAGDHGDYEAFSQGQGNVISRVTQCCITDHANGWRPTGLPGYMEMIVDVGIPISLDYIEIIQTGHNDHADQLTISVGDSGTTVKNADLGGEPDWTITADTPTVVITDQPYDEINDDSLQNGYTNTVWLFPAATGRFWRLKWLCAQYHGVPGANIFRSTKLIGRNTICAPFVSENEEQGGCGFVENFGPPELASSWPSPWYDSPGAAGTEYTYEFEAGMWVGELQTSAANTPQGQSYDTTMGSPVTVGVYFMTNLAESSMILASANTRVLANVSLNKDSVPARTSSVSVVHRIGSGIGNGTDPITQLEFYHNSPSEFERIDLPIDILTNTWYYFEFEVTNGQPLKARVYEEGGVVAAWITSTLIGTSDTWERISLAMKSQSLTTAQQFATFRALTVDCAGQTASGDLPRAGSPR